MAKKLCGAIESGGETAMRLCDFMEAKECWGTRSELQSYFSKLKRAFESKYMSTDDDDAGMLADTSADLVSTESRDNSVSLLARLFTFRISSSRHAASDLSKEVYIESLGAVVINGLSALCSPDSSLARVDGETDKGMYDVERCDSNTSRSDDKASVSGVELVSVTPYSLRERTRFLKVLRVDAQLTPAYREAPCTREMMLRQAIPAVTICFIMVDGLQSESMQVLRDEVRRLLHVWHGYECERNIDGFVLAFSSPSECIEFCVDLSTMTFAAGRDVSSEDIGRSSSFDKELCSLSSLMKIGVYTGIPSLINPHPATGTSTYIYECCIVYC